MSDILRISLPLTAWLVAFSAVYGLQGLVCSPRWAEIGFDLQMGRWALALAAGLSVALQVALLMILRRPGFAAQSRFVQGLSLSLALVALVATLWTLLPTVTTSLCL
jgi:hypothetical protein